MGRTRARLCAFPLRHLVEIMRPLPITRLSGTADFVLGLSVIRGVPTPVVDLGGLLFGAEPAEPARFVTLRLGEGRSAALALEEVLGVRDLSDTSGPLPPLLAGASAEAISSVASLDAELLLVLEAARVVPDSVWLRLDAEPT